MQQLKEFVLLLWVQRRYEAKFGTVTLSNNSDYLKRKLAGQCGAYCYFASLVIYAALCTIVFLSTFNDFLIILTYKSLQMYHEPDSSVGFFLCVGPPRLRRAGVEPDVGAGKSPKRSPTFIRRYTFHDHEFMSFLSSET